MHYSCNTVNAPKGETENISRSWQLFTAQPLQADRLQHVDLGRRCFPFVPPPCRSSGRRLVQLKCCSGRVSALAGRLWVRSRPGHNEDCKNGAHCLRAWHRCCPSLPQMRRTNFTHWEFGRRLSKPSSSVAACRHRQVQLLGGLENPHT